jgi:Family of unknown function (DUF6350)
MASLLSPRRANPAISLQATVRQARRRRPDQRDPDQALLGWFPLGVAGGVLSSLTGWVLIAGTVVVGWLAAEPGTLHQSLDVGTRVWLLSNGVGTRMGTVSVTIVPWGATAVFAFLVYRSAAFAARRAKRRTSTRLVAISAATTAGYLAPVVVMALANENGWSSLPRFGLVRFGLVALVVWLAAALGVGMARGEEPTGRWPRWASDLARGVLGAQLVMLVAGSAVLASALIGNMSRVVDLTSVLNAGIAGGVALLFLQLAIAPNAVVWAGSYALGAGFSIGSSSVVAPAGTELGMLPGLPLLGGLPASGAGSVTQLWWLAGGVVAGALAAWIVVRRGRQARFDQTALLGGTSGVLAGLVFVCLAWASGGDLGAVRLTALGPRLLPLLIMAPTTMGLAGVIVGFCFGLLRRSPR